MNVDALDLATLNELLKRALELPATDRPAWLEGLDTIHAGLRPTLQKLIERADAAETNDFLDTLPKLDRAGAPSDRAAGERIGPYRLLRLLGHGGMGTVWLAERADGALKREVALKLPLIASHPQMRERLVRERDVLAALEHPNIARLYDAGFDQSGQPYLALEYVEGQPIDVYCRAAQLDIRARLAVFAQVARAVAYAHARLILHRDLKPSNILVTAASEARLLDFGVAKLMEGGGTRDTELTQMAGHALTPDYASPEQILGEPLTVASDVYSLGVVLYELLAGERPYRLRRDSRGALEDAILASAPPPPSSAASDRGVRRQVAGDLDTIVQKALKKVPAERYATVAALADDIERHLAGTPVLARRDSLGYRLTRWVRKNKMPVVVAAAILLALLGGAIPTAAVMIALAAGAGVALWQAGVARREAQSARIEARRAERVKQFIASIFTQATPREGSGGVVTAVDLLGAAAERVESELGGEARVAAELGVLIGEGFDALGEPTRGEGTLVKAVERAEREFGRAHPLTLRAKAILLVTYNVAAKYDLGEQLCKRLVPDALAGLPASAELAVRALRSQSFVQAKRNQADASYASLRMAIEIGERELGPLHPVTIAALGLLSNTYGRFEDRRAQLSAAEDAFKRAVAGYGHQRPHTLLTEIERWYATALSVNDRPGDALAILRRVLNDQRLLDGGETTRVQSALEQLSTVLMTVGLAREAIETMRASARLEAGFADVDSDRRHMMYQKIGRMLVIAGLTEEALAWLQKSQDIAARLGNEPVAWAITRAVFKARCLALLGRGADAEGALDAALAGDAAAAARSSSEVLTCRATIARWQERPRVALDLAHRSLAAAVEQDLAELRRGDASTEVGRALLRLGEIAPAEQALLRAVGHYERSQVPPSVRSSDAYVGLAMAYSRTARAEDAERLLRPVIASWNDVNPDALLNAEARLCLACALDALARPAEAAALAGAACSALGRSGVPAFRSLAAHR